MVKSLAHSWGGVLASRVSSFIDLPPFDRSAMDGYALAVDHEKDSYRLVSETAAAGNSRRIVLRRGECARILTGGAIPAGADRVVPQEQCKRSGDEIHLLEKIPSGKHIRYKGEDARKGALVLKAGTLLESVHLAAAAAVGKASLSIFPSPRVAVISTGNEIVEPGKKLREGQIYNTNAIQLASQIRAAGGEPLLLGKVVDQLAAVVAKVGIALHSRADIICISGGASVGDADFAESALRQCGFKIHFHGVDLKPGKPVLFATRGRTLAFGIPGNPVSHLAVFALLVAPALKALRGIGPTPRPIAFLDKPWSGRADARSRWLPAKVVLTRGKSILTLLPWKGSGDSIGCAEANAVANLPGQVTRVARNGALYYAALG